jgi:hypothetical protein
LVSAAKIGKFETQTALWSQNKHEDRDWPTKMAILTSKSGLYTNKHWDIPSHNGRTKIWTFPNKNRDSTNKNWDLTTRTIWPMAMFSSWEHQQSSKNTM